MNYPLDATVAGPLKNLSSAVKKIFPHIFDLKVLICGLPMGQGRIGILGESQPVMQAVLKQMERIAQEEKASVIAFKDFGLADMPVLDFLQEKGFYKFESLPSTEMEICFTSFDGYLKTLSRASREGLKRKFKKLDGNIKIDLEISNDLNGALEEVHDLYLQTVARAENQFEVIPKEFFKNISKSMPAQTKYFLWRMDKKLVAFAFCLISEERFIDYYLGFDYSVAHQYHLYFIRFRDLMNWCIENKMKIYEMGSTSYEPKRRLGFQFIRLFAYAKHRNPWVNPFFKTLCVFLKPENFDSVFKEIEKRDS